MPMMQTTEVSHHDNGVNETTRAVRDTKLTGSGMGTFTSQESQDEKVDGKVDDKREREKTGGKIPLPSKRNIDQEGNTEGPDRCVPLKEDHRT